MWVGAYWQPIYDSKGASLGIRVSLRDISRRKKAEEEIIMAHKELEIRVNERKEELIKVNETLLGEITERKRMKEELRKSEEQYRLFVQNVKEYAIVFYDSEGCIARWNDGAERITGYRAKEIMGRHISVFYSREDIERKKPWRILEMAAVQGQFKEEGWRMRKDGSRYWADVVINALRDERGSLLGFAGMFRDITERMEAQEALKHRLVIEDLVTTISARFVKIAWEEVGQEIDRTVQEVREFIGADHCFVPLLSEDNLTFTRVYESCSDGIKSHAEEIRSLSLESFPWALDKFRRMEILNIPHTGDLPPEASVEKELWQSQSIQSIIIIPMFSDNSLLGLFGFNNERTRKTWTEEDIKLLKLVGEIFVNALVRHREKIEQKKLEDDIREAEKKAFETRLRENEKWSAIGLMASGIAHDIRNPINFVALALRHLSDKDQKHNGKHSKTQKLIEDAHSELRRVSEMIQGLLEYGRTSTLQLSIENASEILIESRKEILRRRPGEESRIRLEGTNDVFPIWVDRNLLCRTLANLLENALEAGDPETQVRAGVGYNSPNKSELALWIQDQGPGIPEENLEKIFNPYFTTKKFGIGLGLALVKKWVQEIEGKIQVSNVPGGGARFELLFPLFDSKISS